MKAEEYRKTLENSKVLVVGAGKSGRAATEALNKIGADVTIQDSKPAEMLSAQFLQYIDNEKIKSIIGKEPENANEFDMIVLSPGVPSELEWIEKARIAGAEIVGEMELAYRICDSHFVAITGTNGKTTTTTLVGEIFREAGRKTAVVGNIGNAVIKEAMDADEDYWMITEVSSFQLETCKYFKPDVSAILNLTPDHLNRHHTMEIYGSTKAKVFAKQTKDEFVVMNLDDEASYRLAENCVATVVPFSRKRRLYRGAYLEGDMIVIKDAAGTIHELCKKDEVSIIGDHNIENILAAAAISFSAGIDSETIARTINKFPGVAHRIEYTRTVDGVKYYNDSKGTNVDAAVIALRALENNIILIAGGDGKAQDFTELAKALDGRVKALVLLGRDAPIIEKCARAEGFENIYNCKDMTECVRKAAELAKDGDKVLLSPACASWDMYKNFEQRGDHFKDCVKQLEK